MTFTHALSTNNYGPAKFVVATSSSNGTHTTLASALSAASSGDTVFLRDSVIENVTIPAGVNITAWQGVSLNTPSITGTVTMTAAGTCTISGIRLITNNAFAVAVTGSESSILNLVDCFIDCVNNTGISYTSSGASSRLTLFYCNGNIATTGISLFSYSSAGILRFFSGLYANSGSSTTASTSSSAQNCFVHNCFFAFPFTTSSSGGFIFSYCNINTEAINTACLTTAGTGISVLDACNLLSGTASAVSIGSGTTVRMETSNLVTSSNTNAITGAGTLVFAYGCVSFESTFSSTVNVTTQTAAEVLNPKGNWTPVITFNATPSSGATYTTQFGYYFKYSNLVTIICNVVTTNKGVTAGNLGIGGLPFAMGSTSGDATSFAVGIYTGLTLGAGRTQVGVWGNNSLSVVNVQCSGSAVAPAAIANTAVNNAFSINFSGTYSTV